MTEARSAFWNDHPGLVWSNPKAGDDVMIRAALLQPRFLELLEIACEFGIDLDFVWLELRLPSQRIAKALAAVEAGGIHASATTIPPR